MMGRMTALGCLAILCASPAHGYVMPADYIVTMLVETIRGQRVRDLSVQLQTDVAGSTEPLDERIYIKRPGRFRRVLGDDEQAEVYVESQGVRARGSGSTVRRLTGPPTDLTATLFAPDGKKGDQRVASVLAALHAVGVDTTVVALGRDGRDPVYIVGARPWEHKKPQVWFSKAKYLPVRFLVYVAGEGAQDVKLEVRFRDYGSSAAGHWFPRLIETYRDGKPERISEVHHIQVNQDLPETLFEIQ